MTAPIVLAAHLRPDDDRPGDIRLPGARRRRTRARRFHVRRGRRRAPSANAAFEPYTLASSLAFATDRLGFAVTSPTIGLHPYHAARRLASLDHLSGGRAGWLVGDEPDRGHAVEYVDIVRSLWDSWDDDAFVRDVDEGRYYDPAGLHTPDYDGFALPGPRPAQHLPAAAGARRGVQDAPPCRPEPDLHVRRARRRHDRSPHRAPSRPTGGARAHTVDRSRRTGALAARRPRRRSARRGRVDAGARCANSSGSGPRDSAR